MFSYGCNGNIKHTRVRSHVLRVALFQREVLLNYELMIFWNVLKLWPFMYIWVYVCVYLWHDKGNQCVVTVSVFYYFWQYVLCRKLKLWFVQHVIIYVYKEFTLLYYTSLIALSVILFGIKHIEHAALLCYIISRVYRTVMST